MSIICYEADFVTGCVATPQRRTLGFARISSGRATTTAGKLHGPSAK